MRYRGSVASRPWLVVLAVLLAGAARGVPAEDDFSAAALRGIGRVALVVEGIPADFARYGLTAEALRQRVEQQLGAYGLPVVDTAEARAARDAGRLRIDLDFNEDAFAFYFYALSVRLERKLPLDGGGESFVSRVVWSHGRSGVLNPSDLRAVHDYVETLVGQFVAAHDRDNP